MQFIGFDEENGIIKNIAKLIPLEALLTGSGSSRPITTKDWKVQGPQRLFPFSSHWRGQSCGPVFLGRILRKKLID